MKSHVVIIGPRGHNIHSHHLRTLIGLSDTKHMPAEGMAPVFVDAEQRNGKTLIAYVKVKVWLDPLKPVRNKERGHRMRAQCPFCLANVSAGRLFQHRCK